jgi:CheY-like chemotaxis protein
MATRLIREEERDTGAHVPIIAITAHAMRGTREEYLAAGMSDFLPKPISVKALAVTLQKFASRAESDGEEEKSTAFAAHSA